MERPLALALEFAPPPARLLEIGVGRGWLLKKAREAGYRVTGLDLSVPGARQAREASGVEVLTGDLPKSNLPESNWEAVLLRHTLEHVPDPLVFLEEVRRILVPGGWLLGAVPNFSSLKRRLDGLDWLFLSLPHHRFHFTPKTLTAVLRKAGLGVVRLRTEEHMAHHRALFQVVLNRARKLAGRNPAPLNYDPAEVKIVSPLTWVLAQEYRLHRFLAWLGWGEELVFAARKD
jgi:SAM-dependent methyltransferase